MIESVAFRIALPPDLGLNLVLLGGKSVLSPLQINSFGTQKELSINGVRIAFFLGHLNMTLCHGTFLGENIKEWESIWLKWIYISSMSKVQSYFMRWLSISQVQSIIHLFLNINDIIFFLHSLMEEILNTPVFLLRLKTW